MRTRLIGVASDVHRHRGDPSLRAFHVRLRDVRRTTIAGLRLKILARSGSSAVGYRGIGHSEGAGWDGVIDLTSAWPDRGVQMFWPFTTTLVEIVLDREPLPFEGENGVVRITPPE